MNVKTEIAIAVSPDLKIWLLGAVIRHKREMKIRLRNPTLLYQ